MSKFLILLLIPCLALGQFLSTSRRFYAPAFDFFAGSNNALAIKNDGKIGIGTTSPGGLLDIDGELRLLGATSGYSGIQAAGTTTSVTYTLPSADGSSGQVLSTNGSGTLSWSTASATPSFTTVTKTANATLATTGEDHVLCDSTSGNVTLTLPAASGNSGLIYKITKLVAGNDCIIDANASETIDGQTTITLPDQYDQIIITTDGTSWYSLARKYNDRDKIQTKYLSADATSIGTLITFSNLVAGRCYTLKAQIWLDLITGSDATFQLQHNSVAVARAQAENDSGSTNDQTRTMSATFIAAATSAVVEFVSETGSVTVFGNPTAPGEETQATIIEHARGCESVSTF